MLNTFKIGGNSTSVTFNQPSTGIIQKSHPKSKIIRIHSKSKLADEVLNWKDDPYIEHNYKKKLITVLQVMCFGDGELLIEIVNNENLVDTQ